MSCPVCGAATSGLCQRCETEQRLERERVEANERRKREEDDGVAEDILGP